MKKYLKYRKKYMLDFVPFIYSWFAEEQIIESQKIRLDGTSRSHFLQTPAQDRIIRSQIIVHKSLSNLLLKLCIQLCCKSPDVMLSKDIKSTLT